MPLGLTWCIPAVAALVPLIGCTSSPSPGAAANGVSAGEMHTVGTTGGAQAVAMTAPGGAGAGASGTSSAAAGSGGSEPAVGAVAAGSGAGGTGGNRGATGEAGAAGTAGASVGNGGVGMPAAGSGGSPATGLQEDDFADCTVGSLPDSGALPTNAKLPDPFKKLDGTRISTKTEWHCRQAEIKKQAENYAYGNKPAKPQSVTGTIGNTNITVNVMDNGKSTTFSAAIVLPSSGTPPYSAIIVYGGLGLGFAAPLDPAVITSESIALINYDVGVTGKEGTPRNNKQGAFYDIAGSNSTSGLLVAWSWGVSRMLDVIAQSDGKVLKAGAVAVTGCSRFGKGAFVAGAFDERIPLTMPIESGTGGAPIWRGIAQEGAQTLSSAYSEQPWFGDAFSAFTSDPTKSPIDTHEIIGLIAPRGLFIMDNPTIANLGPKAGSVAALAGAEIYKSLGAGDSISYYSAIQNGTHCSMRPEWSAPLKSNIRRFLTKTGNDPGVFKIATSAMGDESSWVDWTTPPLN